MKNFTTSIILLLCAFALQAQIINVPGDKSTIQAGIDSASNGDTVLVAEGTYLENISFSAKDITLASQFILDNDTSHIRKTIIDGSSPSNPDTASTIFIYDGEESTPVICGLTITGGKGMLITTGETARVGGGMYIINSACVIENNIITENTIDYDFTKVNSGGISYNMHTGHDVVIRNNSITNNHVTSNQAVRGAGIGLALFNEDFATVIIEGNIISGNTATAKANKGCEAGGLSIFMGLPTNCDFKIRNNMISNNEIHGPETKTYAGAIQIVYFEPGETYKDDNPAPEIYNNIIVGNRAFPGGGAAFGIWTNYNIHELSQGVKPQPVIVNNTVVDNISGGHAGIFNYRSYPLAMNNIFWNTNTDPQYQHVGNVYFGPENEGIIYALHNTIKGGFDDEGIHLNMNNYDFNPYFIQTDSLALSDSSCAIGRGIDSALVKNYWYYSPVNDYSGYARPNAIDGLVDIGAIESPYVRSCDLEPPELTLNSNDTVGIGEPINATSSEDGVIYLVPVNSTLTPEDIQDNALGSVGVNADTPADLPTDTIPQNKYWLVAVDTTGNISKEVEVTLLDNTPPLLTVEDDSIPKGDSIKLTPSEGGYLYLAPPDTPDDIDSLNQNKLLVLSVVADEETYFLTDGLDPGKYWIYAVDDNENISNKYVVTVYLPDGIHETASVSVRLYPSPVHDVLHLESNQDISSVTLYNVTGMRIMHDVTGENSVNVSGLTQGIYFIRIRTESGNVYTGKVIKR